MGNSNATTAKKKISKQQAKEKTDITYSITSDSDVSSLIIFDKDD